MTTTIIPRPEDVGITLPYNLILEADTAFVDESSLGSLPEMSRDEFLAFEMYDHDPFARRVVAGNRDSDIEHARRRFIAEVVPDAVRLPIPDEEHRVYNLLSLMRVGVGPSMVL